MKTDKMDITDLLLDESFINYCKKSSPKDVAFWEAYLVANPDSRALIEYATGNFVQLFNVLAEADLSEQTMRLKNRLDVIDTAPVIQMEKLGVNKVKNIWPMLIKITAVAVILFVVVFFTFNYYNSTKNNKTFLAAYGERKNIQLPDGSVVTLNAGSKIEIDESFDVNNRNVYLEGEAFFDVKHNVKLPFIVQTPAMDVKALGTAFNVKAYLNEKITEASLIRGLVQVTLKEKDNLKMLLYPNQKIMWEQSTAKSKSISSSKTIKETTLNINDTLLKKLVVTDDGDIKEIAWKENKLIFDNQLFSDIAILLERWYGAKIEFKDDELRNYRFTGVFEKEELTTVLELLKESRHFNYQSLPNKTLNISLSK